MESPDRTKTALPPDLNPLHHNNSGQYNEMQRISHQFPCWSDLRSSSSGYRLLNQMAVLLYSQSLPDSQNLQNPSISPQTAWFEAIHPETILSFPTKLSIPANPHKNFSERFPPAHNFSLSHKTQLPYRHHANIARLLTRSPCHFPDDFPPHARRHRYYRAQT